MKNMRAASFVTTDAAEMHTTRTFSFCPLGETASFQYISFQWRRLISCDCFHSSFQVTSTKSSCQAGVVQDCGGILRWVCTSRRTHGRKQVASQLWVEIRCKELKKPFARQVKRLEKSSYCDLNFSTSR